MATGIVIPGTSGGDSGGITPSGGDITGELGSLLGDAFDTASQEESQQPIGDDLSEGADLNEPAAQDPAQNAAPDSQEGQPPADPNSTPYPLSEDGQSYLVPKAELSSIQTDRTFAKEVGQYFASPQEAHISYLQASDLRAMGNDWMQGSDQAIQGVLSHWAGANHAHSPAVQAKYQASFAKMASMLPEQLKTVNPQAYGTMVDGMIGKAIERAYERAVQSQNPEDFKRAQELDWGATGQYKTELPKVDSRAAQETALEAKMREFNTRQDAALNRDIGNFNQQTVEGAKFKQLNGMIDKLLEPVKARYGDTAYADLRAGIQRELMTTLQNQPEWFLEHRQTWDQIMDDYKTSWKAGQGPQALQPRINAYVSDFISRAKRFLPSITQKRIGATTSAQRPRTPQGQFAPQARQGAPATPAPNGSPAPTNGRWSSDQWDQEWNKQFETFRR